LNNEHNITTRFTFPKAEHLKSRKAIDQLFQSGKSFFVKPYKVFYQIQSTVDRQSSTVDRPPLEGNVAAELSTANCQLPTVLLQAGFAVSSRNFKHAVDRNRVKRIGREAYRLNKHPLTKILAEQNKSLQVFFVYTDKVLPNFAVAEEKMKECLIRLISIVAK